jgi:hypothetical protein
MARIIRLFVASPSDVATERDYVADVAAALNRNMAAERDVRFDVLGWKTHARARVDDRGPQGPIDEDLPVEQCDIVVGILWKRLGTPIPEMGGEAGTEHEIRAAIAAWRKSGKPEVVICANEALYRPKDVEESKQATRVMEFREEIRGLELAYDGATDFRDKIRDYLEKYLIAHHRVVPGKAAAAGDGAIGGDPTRYIKALRDESSHFDVQGLVVGDNRAYRFPIDEFYIPLTTSSSAGPIPLQEALLAHPKLLVVGDPGSGKSTFLKRVAFQLCNEFATGGPLPMRIEAAVLSAYIAQQHERKLGPADPASPDWIPVFLGAQCEEKNRGLPADYFRVKLKAGGCYVLIDGLDETPDEPSRERLVKLIREAAAAFEGCRFVVTSRPEGKIPIAGFEEALIGDLEPEAIRAFLAKLAKQLYPTDETRERTFREELEAAVNGRREIRKMTRNPVMLTALAVLQHNNVKLPEKRVDLYGSILEWLSKQRAKKGRMPAGDCLLRLRELALEMQNHEEGRQKQVTLAWAGEKLAKRFANREAAERFLRAEQADSGIVVSRGREIAYWHLTFQEYLAALEIAGWPDADQFQLLLDGEPRIYRPEWRETVLLYGGLLHNIGPRKVDALVRGLLDGMGEHPGLADRAKCVGLVGALLPDLVGYTVSDKRYEESLRLVMDIFDTEKSKSVRFTDRLAAAEALGQAGDPRLKKHEWVTIPAVRNYWIGAQRKDPKGRNYDKEAYDFETLHKVSLAPFRIGKYPVTVAQYLPFVEEGTAPGPRAGELGGAACASELARGERDVASGRGVLRVGRREAAHRGGVGTRRPWPEWHEVPMG